MSWTELRRGAQEPVAHGDAYGDDEAHAPAFSAAQRAYMEHERRQKQLNQNQVLAAAHFIRRMKLFVKHLIHYQPLLGGKLTDYIIRYETQGRGSVHAHMLWWIDIDPTYIPESDVISLSPELLLRYGLAVKKSSQRNTGGEIGEEFLADHGNTLTEPCASPTTDLPQTHECSDVPVPPTRGEEEEENLSNVATQPLSRPPTPSPGATQTNEEDEVLVKLYNEQFLTYTNANIWALKKPENIRKKLHIGIPPIESLSYVIVDVV